MALTEESIAVPPWEVPPKLPEGLAKPTEGKAKGKVHPKQVPEWVASSRMLLLGYYGITNCKVEGCTNLGRAWSKGDQKEYHCDDHCQLLKEKRHKQSAINQAKWQAKACGMQVGAHKSWHLLQQKEAAAAKSATKTKEDDSIDKPTCRKQP